MRVVFFISLREKRKVQDGDQPACTFFYNRNYSYRNPKSYFVNCIPVSIGTYIFFYREIIILTTLVFSAVSIRTTYTPSASASVLNVTRFSPGESVPVYAVITSWPATL